MIKLTCKRCQKRIGVAGGGGCTCDPLPASPPSPTTPAPRCVACDRKMVQFDPARPDMWKCPRDGCSVHHSAPHSPQGGELVSWPPSERPLICGFTDWNGVKCKEVAACHVCRPHMEALAALASPPAGAPESATATDRDTEVRDVYYAGMIDGYRWAREHPDQNGLPGSVLARAADAYLIWRRKRPDAAAFDRSWSTTKSVAVAEENVVRGAPETAPLTAAEADELEEFRHVMRSRDRKDAQDLLAYIDGLEKEIDEDMERRKRVKAQAGRALSGDQDRASFVRTLERIVNEVHNNGRDA